MILIDTVYQRVLAIANKEQRGYITPLEFNLLANQASLDVFEQYFYDLDQFKRQPSETTTFSDMEELIRNKLAIFTTVVNLNNSATSYPLNYRTGRIFVLVGSVNYEATLIDMNELRSLLDSPFHASGLEKNPVYVHSNISGRDVEVYDHNGLRTSNVSCEVITEPVKVEWGYDVIAEKALYNADPTRTVNFEHHLSDETTMVMKILELAGVIIQNPGIMQYADQEDLKKIQQQKS
jgi:hypothetical protein